MTLANYYFVLQPILSPGMVQKSKMIIFLSTHDQTNFSQVVVLDKKRLKKGTTIRFFILTSQLKYVYRVTVAHPHLQWNLQCAGEQRELLLM
jgi:hypothetical protein